MNDSALRQLSVRARLTGPMGATTVVARYLWEPEDPGRWPDRTPTRRPWIGKLGLYPEEREILFGIDETLGSDADPQVIAVAICGLCEQAFPALAGVNMVSLSALVGDVRIVVFVETMGMTL